MWVFLAVAGASALAGAGTATTTGKSATYLISCLGMAPCLATSPTPPSAAGVGTPMAVVPREVSTREVIGNIPVLIAPAAR